MGDGQRQLHHAVQSRATPPRRFRLGGQAQEQRRRHLEGRLLFARMGFQQMPGAPVVAHGNAVFVVQDVPVRQLHHRRGDVHVGRARRLDEFKGLAQRRPAAPKSGLLVPRRIGGNARRPGAKAAAAQLPRAETTLPIGRGVAAQRLDQTRVGRRVVFPGNGDDLLVEHLRRPVLVVVLVPVDQPVQAQQAARVVLGVQPRLQRVGELVAVVGRRTIVQRHQRIRFAVEKRQLVEALHAVVDAHDVLRPVVGLQGRIWIVQTHAGVAKQRKRLRKRAVVAAEIGFDGRHQTLGPSRRRGVFAHAEAYADRLHHIRHGARRRLRPRAARGGERKACANANHALARRSHPSHCSERLRK